MSNDDKAGELAYTLVDIERTGLVPGSRAYAAALLEAGYQKVDENTSDGYHTFRDLYDHRRALTAALLVAYEEAFPGWHWDAPVVWRSRAHHPDDSVIYSGHFIVGLQLPGGTITYHYPDQFWDDFQKVTEIEHAPKWDGAAPEATVTCLIDFAKGRR